MHHFWHKVEKANARLIPYALVLLLIIIIFELFIHPENHAVEFTLEVVDYVVIFIFVVDLIFLAIKARSTVFFFKNYWLDVLAVFPFGLLFSAVERLYLAFAATERLVLGQSILHETLEVKKELRLLSQGERAGKFARVVARGLRIVTKSRVFTTFHTQKQRADQRMQLHQKHRAGALQSKMSRRK